jgi:hypothetical protein
MDQAIKKAVNDRTQLIKVILEILTGDTRGAAWNSVHEESRELVAMLQPYLDIFAAKAVKEARGTEEVRDPVYIPRTIPVTDDRLDAPDGAEYTCTFKRVGSQWERIDCQPSIPQPSDELKELEEDCRNQVRIHGLVDYVDLKNLLRIIDALRAERDSALNSVAVGASLLEAWHATGHPMRQSNKSKNIWEPNFDLIAKHLRASNIMTQQRAREELRAAANRFEQHYNEEGEVDRFMEAVRIFRKTFNLPAR